MRDKGYYRLNKELFLESLSDFIDYAMMEKFEKDRTASKSSKQCIFNIKTLPFLYIIQHSDP